MTCPPREMLEQLLAEGLNDSEVLQLSQHLERCSRCRCELDSLTTPSHAEAWLCHHSARLREPGPSQRFLRSLEKLVSEQIVGAIQATAGTTDWPKPPKAYEFIEILGRGGSGLVFKARHISLNRLVAVKILASGSEATSFQEARFRSEAQVIASLQHPHIVQIFEIGEQDGRPFLALELVTGGSLAKWLANGPLSTDVALLITEKISRAVEFAHRHGVIHRDLKPQNILIHRLNTPTSLELANSSDRDALVRTEAVHGEIWPKVTDFGLAKRLDAAGPTQTGEILGTPSYMAPEQVRGDRCSEGPAVDVYGLGAILYHMLTGRPPFQGVTAVETMMQVLQTDPVPPRQLQPNLPIDVETICLKCLEKDPRQRYTSAADLADDLYRWRTGQPILAKRLGAYARARRWCHRNPIVSTILGAFVLIFVTVIWSLVKTENARQKEIRSRQEEQAQRELAELRLHYSRIALAENEWEANNVSRAESLLDHLQPLSNQPGRRDHRDWEWYYLKRLCHADLMTRVLHQWPIYSVCFSPDGRFLVSAAGSPGFQYDARSTPGEVRVWDSEGYRLIAELPGHSGRVCAAMVSPDGSQLASIGLDNKVRVWSTTTWREQFALTTSVFGEFSGVGLSYSPDGKQLAVVNDRRLQIHDSQNGSLLASFGPYPQPVVNAIFSPLADKLAVGYGSIVNILDLKSKQPLFQIDGSPLAVAFSPDATMLAVARKHAVILIDMSTGREIRTLWGHNGLVRTLAWSRDGHLLATGSTDQTVRLWDPESGAERRRFRGHAATVLRLAFHPCAEQLVSADMFGTLKVWDLHRDQRGVILPSRAEVCDITFSPDGQHVFVAHAAQGRGTIEAFDATSGRPSYKTSTPWSRRTEWPLKYLAFSPDARLLAAPDVDDPTLIRVWSLATQRVIRTLRGHRERVRTLAFDANGNLLASAAGNPNQPDSGELLVWRLSSETPENDGPLRLPCTELVQCLAFSPDGQLLCAGERASKSSPEAKDPRGFLSIWNVSTQSLMSRWQAHDATVQCVAWHPGGRLLASGGRALDNNIHVWNALSGTLEHAMLGPAVLTCLNFNPTGSRLAAVGYDGVVLLFDPYIGQEVLTLRGLTPHRPAERAVDSQVIFSPDGNKIAVNIWDGSICVFDATPLPSNKADFNRP